MNPIPWRLKVRVWLSQSGGTEPATVLGKGAVKCYVQLLGQQLIDRQGNREAAGSKKVTFAETGDIATAVARGEVVIMVDDEDHETEGNLILAAEDSSPDKIAFMLRHSYGILCLAILGEKLEALDLPLMVDTSAGVRRPAFTVSIDAAEGVTTGISATDRWRTIQAVLNPKAKPDDLTRPGHVYPLLYESGGVLKRGRPTEAAVDLARLAGKFPAGVLTGIMNDDGTVARLPDLQRLAKDHGLVMGTIADLIAHRRRFDKLVERVTDVRLPTDHGTFNAIGFHSLVDDRQYVALVMGDLDDGESVLTQVNVECLIGSVFGSLRCDCERRRDQALARVAEEGRGVVIHVRADQGKVIDLIHQPDTYWPQEEDLNTVDAKRYPSLPVDSLDNGFVAQILHDLGVRSVRQEPRSTRAQWYRGAC